MSETVEYKSSHRCAELDEAIANYLAMQQAVTDTAASALAAQQSATDAAASADAAQQVSQGAVGYYATPEALRAAHPTAEDGNWAIVGTTDTIWVWDSDTSAWKDSGQSVDLSDYYTKEQSDALISTEAIRAKGAEKANADAISAETTRAQAAEASLTQTLIDTENMASHKVVSVSGTTSPTVGGTVTLAYPSGYTAESCVMFAYKVSNGTGYAENGYADRVQIILDASGIKVYTNHSSLTSKCVQVWLYK